MAKYDVWECKECNGIFNTLSAMDAPVSCPYCEKKNMKLLIKEKVE